MYRWRTLAGLFVALLCFMLAGQVAQAEQGKGSTSDEEQSAKSGPGTDEEEVIVKPRGPTPHFPRKGHGFDWFRNDKSPLKNGKAGQFRCDLYEHMRRLQAARTEDEKPEDAVAVLFELDGVIFGVSKDGEKKYTWSLPGTKPCKIKGKKDCSEDGVPPEFMHGKVGSMVPEKMKAKFKWDSDWVDVAVVSMYGGRCY